MATQQAPRPGNSGPEESSIGQDLIITGDVTSKSALVIDGQIRGNVHCASLVLGESSEIEGNVVAEDVVIRGRVIGSIRGVRVTLQSTCHIEGDLVHASLAMEQGAYFEGRSRRSENPLASDPPKSEKPAAVEQHEATGGREEPSRRFIRTLTGTKSAEEHIDKTSA